MKLLHTGVMMGVIHPCPGLIGNLPALFHCLGRIDHILVKDCPPHKAPQLLVSLSPISRADIGAKKGLDPQPVQILLSFKSGGSRIVKLSGNLLQDTTALARELAPICHSHPPPQVTHQMLQEPSVRRQRILGQHHKDLRIGKLYRRMPCAAMIKLPLGEMPDHQVVIPFQQLLFRKAFLQQSLLRIH